MDELRKLRHNVELVDTSSQPRDPHLQILDLVIVDWCLLKPVIRSRAGACRPTDGGGSV